MPFSPQFLWPRTNLWFFLARGCAAVWVRVGLVAENGLAAAVRRVFAIFAGLFFRYRFREFEDDLFKLPSFSCRVLLLSAFSSTQPCTCVLGQLALNPSFLPSYTSTVSPWKRVFLFISLCLPSPWASFTSPFHTLSLSLSLSCLFLCSCLYLPSLLFCFFNLPCFWLFFLALFLCFCFMKRTTSKYYMWKVSFHQIFLFLGGFLFCFVIPLFSII